MSPTSPRPPACSKVHQDSRGIHKQQASSSSPPSSSSTHSSVSSSSTNSRQPQQQRRPVIIYTHSPKVIRTSPRDFMSIVQKLTGLDPARAAAAQADESSSSSSESCANAHAQAYADQRMMPPPPSLLDAQLVGPPDIPLFAPGPSELQLCVPQGLYDEFPAIDAAQLAPAVMHSSNNMDGGGPVFSPSMVEAMRTFQDY